VVARVRHCCKDARVQLTPSERDRLLIFTVAELARARRARGLRLNVPEATALIADAVAEAARDGRRHDEALEVGRSLLGPDDVLPGVADILYDVKVEAVFDDGTRLVVVPDPIGGGSLGATAPGAITVAADAEADPSLDADRSLRLDVVTIDVENTASVPITVTSHFHFLEVNPRLSFDRAAAYGRHLDIAAGASTAFEPGTIQSVRLVPIRGERVVIGFAGLVDGALDAPGARERALELLRATGFLDTGNPGSHSRAEHAVSAMRQHLAAHPEVQS
jgi:urease subunit gamma/beta